MIERRLNPKQQAFADYYIETGNVTESAVKAGYSKKTAAVIGTENLKKPNIRAYIDQRMEEIKSKRIADQTEVMEFLTAVMRGEVVEPMSLLDGEGTQRVVNVKPSVQTRRAAAVDIGKRYAMWTEKQQVEMTLPVFTEDVPLDDD